MGLRVSRPYASLLTRPFLALDSLPTADPMLTQQENVLNSGNGRDMSNLNSSSTDLAIITTAPADSPENVSHTVVDSQSPSTPVPPTPRVTQSLDVPTPVSGDRSPSPSSAQHSLLDRRASRRRSGIDVCHTFFT